MFQSEPDVLDNKTRDGDVDSGAGDGPQTMSTPGEVSATPPPAEAAPSPVVTTPGLEVPTDQLVDISLMEETDDSQYQVKGKGCSQPNSILLG